MHTVTGTERHSSMDSCHCTNSKRWITGSFRRKDNRHNDDGFSNNLNLPSHHINSPKEDSSIHTIISAAINDSIDINSDGDNNQQLASPSSTYRDVEKILRH